VVEKSPAEPEEVLSVAQANCLVVAFQTSFSLAAEQEVSPAPVMVEAMLKDVVVAFVAWSTDAKNDVDVALVDWNVVAKREVEVALVVVAFTPVKFWSVVDAKVMSPPQNCEAVVEVETM
jgi:hypothetical protein